MLLTRFADEEAARPREGGSGRVVGDGTGARARRAATDEGGRGRRGEGGEGTPLAALPWTRSPDDDGSRCDARCRRDIAADDEAGRGRRTGPYAPTAYAL